MSSAQVEAGVEPPVDAGREPRSEAVPAAQPERAAQTVIGPDGELQKHRETVQELSSEALKTQATLETLRKERASLEELRGHLRDAEHEVKQTLSQVHAVRSGEDASLRKDAASLEALRSEVGALAARTKGLETLDKRLDALTQNRQDFEGLRKDVQDLHKLHVEIERLRDMLGTDRLAIQAHTQPASTARVQSPTEADPTVPTVAPPSEADALAVNEISFEDMWQ